MAQETYTAALAVLLVVIESGAGRVGARARAQYRFYPYFSAKPPYQTPQTTVPDGQCSGRACVPRARRLLRPKMSRPLLLSFSKARSAALPITSVRKPVLTATVVRVQQREASSTNSSKHISLEQPDKFRPPSHASRLVKGRSRGSTFNGAYNQSSTDAERDAQRHRKYPHMFPDEGTLAYRVLTNRNGHVLLSIVSVLIQPEFKYGLD
jgi:hypothetical protein